MRNSQKFILDESTMIDRMIIWREKNSRRFRLLYHKYKIISKIINDNCLISPHNFNFTKKYRNSKVKSEPIMVSDCTKCHPSIPIPHRNFYFLVEVEILKRSQTIILTGLYILNSFSRIIRQSNFKRS